MGFTPGEMLFYGGIAGMAIVAVVAIIVIAVLAGSRSMGFAQAMGNSGW